MLECFVCKEEKRRIEICCEDHEWLRVCGSCRETWYKKNARWCVGPGEEEESSSSSSFSSSSEEEEEKERTNRRVEAYLDTQEWERQLKKTLCLAFLALAATLFPSAKLEVEGWEVLSKVWLWMGCGGTAALVVSNLIQMAETGELFCVGCQEPHPANKVTRCCPDHPQVYVCKAFRRGWRQRGMEPCVVVPTTRPPPMIQDQLVIAVAFLWVMLCYSGFLAAFFVPLQYSAIIYVVALVGTIALRCVWGPVEGTALQILGVASFILFLGMGIGRVVVASVGGEI